MATTVLEKLFTGAMLGIIIALSVTVHFQREDLKSIKENKEVMQNELASAKESLSTLNAKTGDADKLRESVAEEQKKTESLLEKQRSLDAEIDNYIHMIAALRENEGRSKTSMDEAAAKISELEQLLSEAQAVSQSKQKELDEALGTVNSLQGDYNSLANLHEESKAKYAAELQQAEEQRSAWENAHAECAKQIKQ